MTAARDIPRKLVLLAGGKGTRLSELTGQIPKPAVDVNGRPLITYLCDWAFAAGIRNIIIAAGYKQAVLKRRLIDHYELSGDVSIDRSGLSIGKGQIPDGCTITIRDTGPEAETAERLYALKDLVLPDERFVFTYGDTLTDLDASALFAHADRADKLITMCVGRPDGRYGEIKISADDAVTAFEEKRRPEFYVNRGFFVVRSALFDAWQPQFVSFEKDVVPYYAVGGNVSAYRAESWFHSVDSVKDLQELEQHLRKQLKHSGKPQP
jgi:glucose-1-phosphate cytidylyltransferase